MINSFPNFKSKVDMGGEEFEIHFAALFSEKKDAIPLILLHGWPGTSSSVPLFFSSRLVQTFSL
jgi:uncharacterized alpha/beta hydrolase family protein